VLAGGVAVGDHLAAAAVLEAVRAGLGGGAVHALAVAHGGEVVVVSRCLVVVVLWWWLMVCVSLVSGKRLFDRVHVKK
jgi:hypothetical protein